MTDSDRLRRPVGRRRAVRTAGLAALAGGLGLAAAEAAAQPEPAGGIVGVWRTSATVGPNRPATESIAVFIPGGIFLHLDAPVELTANLRDIPDAIEHVGQFAGQWVEQPDGSVRVLAIQLNYDRRPVLTSEERVTITATLEPGGNSFSGSFRWRETTLAGTEVLASEGDIRGTRITVDTPEP